MRSCPTIVAPVVGYSSAAPVSKVTALGDVSPTILGPVCQRLRLTTNCCTLYGLFVPVTVFHWLTNMIAWSRVEPGTM